MVAAAVIGTGVATAAIGAGTSAAGGSAASSANKKAAEQAAKQYAETKAYLTEATKTARTDLQPYTDIGTGAQNQLAWAMGTGGTPAGYTGTGAQGALGQAIPTNTPFTAQDYQNDALYTPMANTLEQYQQNVGYTPMVTDLASLQATPGYQFQLEQGLQGVSNSAAAKGSLLSGRQLKDVNNYAQGVASTGYQDAWTRAQQAYQNAFARGQGAYQQAFNNNQNVQNTAFNQANTNQSNQFQRLQNMGAAGQNAASGQGNYSMTGAAALAGASTNYGNTQTGLTLAQGQNQANMYTGIGNAVSSGIGTGMGLYGSGNQIGGTGNAPSSSAGKYGVSNTSFS